MPDQVQAAKTLSPQLVTPASATGITGMLVFALTSFFPKYITPEIGNGIASFLGLVYLILKHRKDEQVKQATVVAVVAAADNQNLPGLPAQANAVK